MANAIAKIIFGTTTAIGLVSGVLLIAHCIIGGFFFTGATYNTICNNLCGGILLGLLTFPLLAIATANFPKQS